MTIPPKIEKKRLEVIAGGNWPGLGLPSPTEVCSMASELLELRQQCGELEKIRRVVKIQAEDKGLWFLNPTIGEAYIQQALHELHRVIEAKR